MKLANDIRIGPVYLQLPESFEQASGISDLNIEVGSNFYSTILSPRDSAS